MVHSEDLQLNYGADHSQNDVRILLFLASRRIIGARAFFNDALTLVDAYEDRTVISCTVFVDGAKRSDRSDGVLPRLCGS